MLFIAFRTFHEILPANLIIILLLNIVLYASRSIYKFTEIICKSSSTYFCVNTVAMHIWNVKTIFYIILDSV